ncbi:MAG: hypothetical protein IPK20_00335 [Betaproteobacteria bacterium]|nr:hypothetical protein [Betaproteobacteria bacterium]
MRHFHLFIAQALILLLGVAAGGVRAQSISGVSGALQHEESVTIGGSGFGTKPAAPPVIWDDIEAGSFSSRWSNTGSPGVWHINQDNQRHSNSRYNATANFVGNDYVEHATLTGGSNSPRWFCQYWFKLGSDWTWGTATNGGLGSNLANVKIFRMWSTGSAQDNWVVATEGWSNSLIYKSSGPINESGWFGGGFKERWTLGTWHLIQVEYKDSSQRDLRDGAVKIWFDGELVLDDSTLPRAARRDRLKASSCARTFSGSSIAGATRRLTATTSTWTTHTSTTTWARVELGDAPHLRCLHSP